MHSNRRERTVDGQTYIYSHNDLHQITSIKNKETHTDIATFAYDANGNMISKSEGSTVTALNYDALDRLVAVNKTGLAKETYAYDHGIRRIKKTVGSDVQQFHYSGPDIIAEYGNDWDKAKAVYSHGAAIDDPLLRLAANDPRYYHGDGLGSITAVSDGQGNIVATNAYDHWGNITASTGTTPQFGYTGREPDATGLVYYRNRYYDPQIGRFTQLDPKGFIDGVNRYAYVMNSPVNYVDPWGLAKIGSTIGGNAGGYVDVIRNSGGIGAYGFNTIRNEYQSTFQKPLSQHEIAAIDSGFTSMPILPIEWAVSDIGNAINDGVQALSAGDIGGAVIAASMGFSKATPLGKIGRISQGTKKGDRLSEPDSIYVQVTPDGRSAIQTSIYNCEGKLCGHVDYRPEGPSAPSGHGHIIDPPGTIEGLRNGHGKGAVHILPKDVPKEWHQLPEGVSPLYPIGTKRK